MSARRAKGRAAPQRAPATDAVGDPVVVEQRVVGVSVERVDGGAGGRKRDFVAVEEPLEIRVVHGQRGLRRGRSLTVTMRTPGDDRALAVGFLFAEGVVRGAADVERVESCGPAAGVLQVRNIVRVELAPHVELDAKLQRSFLTTSACGLCGKASLDALPRVALLPRRDGFTVAPAMIHALSAALRREQAVFARTGGLHAAALFDRDGRLLDLHEDVGRHNALDKLIGARVLAGATPLSDGLVFVSGRAGYELVQKALAAGAPVLAAVGAPSSLAVDLARHGGMTLLGFVRDDRFNVYSGAHRVRGAVHSRGDARQGAA